MSLVTGLFFLLLLLNKRRSPPLRVQVSDCSTFRITCDVPGTAVFCSASIECFPGMASKFVTISVTPITTGIVIHFVFHIRCISIHKPLYFSLFSASFCTKFLSAGIATTISMYVYYTWPICRNFPACVYHLIPTHNTVTSGSRTGLCVCVCLCVCVYHLSVVSMARALRVE